MTLANVSMVGYVRVGTRLTYVSQAARNIVLSGADGAYWLALAHDTHSAAAGYTRVPGSHYLWRGPDATQPADPAGGLVVAYAVVSGGNIIDVGPLTQIASPLMSQQHAGAVAITGGMATLTELSVPHLGMGVAPGPNVGLLIQSQYNAAIQVQDFFIGGGAFGYVSNLAAGSGKWNFYVGGTAQNYFAGNVAIGSVAAGVPGYPLHVGGLTRLDETGIRMAPNTGTALALQYNRATQNGLAIFPSADGGAGSAVSFQNAAGTTVGSIVTNATATAYNTASDTRLKRNIAPLADALASLKAVRPVSYLHNVDDSYGEGFLAHELMVPFPLAVSGQPDARNPDGSIKPQQVDMSKMIPRITAWIQELLTRIESLESALGL